MKCVIGRLVLSFSGDDAMAKLICQEFGTTPTTMNSELKVLLRSVLNLSLMEGDLKKSERGRFYDTGYAVVLPKNEAPLVISFDKSVLGGGIKSRIATLWDWSFLSPDMIVAKNLIYDVLEPMAHGIMVKEMTGFIHASSVSNGRTCILFTGEGGMGKTAMCLLAARRGFEYLNDDLSLIDSTGLCYHHPKKLQIYGYNIQHSPWLKKKVFQDRRATDKLQWGTRYLFLGPKRVRRRTSPKDLFEVKSTSVKISKVVFLRRGDTIKIRNMKRKDFIDSELVIINNEFSDYTNALEQTDRKSLNNMISDTEELYGLVYDSTDCLEVTVPKSIELKKLFSILEKEQILA